MGWWEASKQNHNILFLFYEDFIINPSEFFDKIAKFLGVEVAVERKIEILNKLSIEMMRGNEQTDYIKGRREELPGFMRKGAIGDWKNHFTKEQNEEFDACYQEKIVNKSDLRFIFE